MKKMNGKETKNISLKDYFDMRFNELKNYMDIRFNSIDKATILSNESLDARLEGMNEFRNSMKDQASSFITRQEFSICIERLGEDVKLLREINAKSEGKASQNSVNIAYVIAFVGIIIGICGLLIKLI
jgi:hypothetical protein